MRTTLLSSLLLTTLSLAHGQPFSDSASGGTTTIQRSDEQAFAQPLANLSPLRRLDFSVGNSFFRNPWVMAPASTTARDGLGPLFNTNSCLGCHIRDGRGQPPTQSQANNGFLVRLSIPASKDSHQGPPQPDPIYGGQLQNMALPGVKPEGQVALTYTTEPVHFSDGFTVELRRPSIHFLQLAYGPMSSTIRLSGRIAPPLIGLGLLEAIPDEALLAHSDPQDRNGDGISGRPNLVSDVQRQTLTLGRFGWKAAQPTLLQQSADALRNDMGLTSNLFPVDNCSSKQILCQQQTSGGHPEVSAHILQQIAFYTRTLAVPARRQPNSPQVRQGQQLFHQAGCHQCHVPRFTTRPDAQEPELANQTIWPYTDLLLHDMGPGLADQHREFQAAGHEWRTPPLWGIGLTQTVSGHTQFLHDGRARNLLEAILWHGGEAKAAQQTVLGFNQQQREALLAFLNSL